MAAAKTIKVNLTLDDQGFTTKVQDANGKISALNKTFGAAAKAASGMEVNLGKIREATKGASSAISSFGKSFEGAKASLTKLGESAREIRKDLNSIATNTQAVTGKFRDLANSANATDRSFRGIASTTSKIAADLIKLDAATRAATTMMRNMGREAKAVASDIQSLRTSVTSLNNSSAAIDAAVRRATTAITQFTQHMHQMNQVTGQVARNQNAAAASINHTGSTFHNWIWTLGMAREAAFTLFDVFLRAPIGIINTNAELERMQKLFEGMSEKRTAAGRAADGVDTKNKLLNMSLNMPFDVKTLTDAAVKLKSSGIDPLNGSLQNLADSVAYFGGTSDQFHRAAIAIQQMSGKGVVSMEELRQQLGEAVPNAMRLMATSMGLTMAELTQKVSKGQVEAKSALTKMFAQMELEMGGAGKRMMQTWSGMWEGFKSRMVIFQEQIGKSGFFEEMRKKLSDVLAAMDDGKVRGFADAVGNTLTKIVRELNDLLTRCGPLIDAMTNALRVAGATAVVVWDVLKGLVTTLANLERATGLVSGAMYAWMATATVSKIVAMTKGIRDLGAAQAAAAKEAATLATAQAGASAAAATGAVQAGLLARTTAGLSTAMVSAGTGIAMFGRGLLALAVSGGPIMALTAGIGYAIGKMIEWANVAQETTQRVRLAAAGQAPGWKNSDELKIDINGLKESQANVQRAQRELQDTQTKLTNAQRFQSDNKNYIKTLQTELERRQRVLSNFVAKHEMLTKAYSNNKRKFFADKAESAERNIQLKYDRDEDQYRRKIRDSQVDFEKSDEFKKLSERQRSERLAKIQAQGSAAYITALRAALDKTKDKVEAGIISDKIKKIQAETVRYGVVGTPNTYIAPKKSESGGRAANGGSQATIQDDQNPLINALEKAQIDADLAKLEFDALAKSMNGVTKAQQQAELEVQKLFMGGSLDKGILIKNGDTKNRTLNGKERAEAFRQYGAELVKVKAQEIEYAAQAKVMGDVDKAARDAALDLAQAKAEVSSVLGQVDPVEKFTEAIREQAAQAGYAGEKLDELNAKVKKTAADMAQAAALRRNRRLSDENDQTDMDRISDLDQRVKAQGSYEIGRLKRDRDETVARARLNGVSESEIEVYKSEMNRKIASTSEDYAYKAQGALGELLKKWQDVSGGMKQIAADFTSGFADELTNLVVSGKGNFADLAESMIKQIIKINLQLMITKLLTDALGLSSGFSFAPTSASAGSLSSMPNLLPPNAFAKGGAFGSSGVINRFAKGGAFTNSIATGPTLAPMALFGEAGPEAIMPLAQNGNGELGVRVFGAGTAGQQQTAVVVNVINASGQQVNAEQRGKPRFDGKQMILDVVLSAVSTPGSFRDGIRAAVR